MLAVTAAIEVTMAPPQMGGRVSRGVAFLFGVDMILARLMWPPKKEMTMRTGTHAGNPIWNQQQKDLKNVAPLNYSLDIPPPGVTVTTRNGCYFLSKRSLYTIICHCYSTGVGSKLLQAHPTYPDEFFPLCAWGLSSKTHKTGKVWTRDAAVKKQGHLPRKC